MLMKRILFFIIALLSAGSAYSQQDEDLAESYMIDENYKAAVEIYSKLVAEHPGNPDLQFNLGFCLMNSETGRYSAIEHFERAISTYEKNPETADNLFSAYFYLGESYHINYQFDKAIETYNKILALTNDAKVKKIVNRNLASSKLALEYFMNPTELVVTKLGAINSPYTDHSPVISADENVLIFTSRRPGGVGNDKTESGQFYEDVYIYDKRKGFEAKPENIGAPINTKWHEATCGLSVDGQEMLLYRSTGENDGNIYHSKLEGNKWSEPRKLGSNINSKGRETHASLSADGKYLYFTSNRKGGQGGYDIYVSKKNQDGSWGKAKNLGKTINTEFDEEGPYIHPDGKTLYFSSKGHPGIGGYDVFYSVKDKKGNWSKPVNMGFPLNTVDNDVFYVPTADGKRGYYASENGGSSNIYIARLYNQEEKILTLVSGIFKDSYQQNHSYAINDCKINGDTTVLPNNRVLYQDVSFYQGDSVVTTHRNIGLKEIKINDSIYKVPEEASIFVLNTDNKMLENTYAPNSVTGEYLFVLSDRKDYKIYFEADGYIFDTKDIPLKNDHQYRKIYYVAETDTIQKGKVHKSKKIGFDMGMTSLTNYTSLELDLLAYFLKKHDDLFVNIAGYDYLLNQSNRKFFRLEYEYAEKRKERVIKYLIDKGVNPKNIYTDMFPANIIGDSLEYTIFDKIMLEEAVKVKEERREFFTEVQEVANLTEAEIYERYGTPDDEMTAVKTVFVKDMLFDLNKYQTQKYNDNLKNLANYLKNNPDAIIEIRGHTDEQGPAAYNKNLAVKRAAFVRSQLIKRGANIKQIKIKGYGHSLPIAKNKKEDGSFYWESLKYNRRITINVIKQGKNAKLIVSRIKIPEEYKAENDRVEEFTDNFTNSGKPKVYAISLMVTDKKHNLDEFSKYKNVHEKQYPNGKFMYFYGNFTNEDKLLDEISAVKSVYPDAFIFLKQ